MVLMVDCYLDYLYNMPKSVEEAKTRTKTYPDVFPT